MIHNLIQVNKIKIVALKMMDYLKCQVLKPNCKKAKIHLRGDNHKKSKRNK